MDTCGISAAPIALMAACVCVCVCVLLCVLLVCVMNESYRHTCKLYLPGVVAWIFS